MGGREGPGRAVSTYLAKNACYVPAIFFVGTWMASTSFPALLLAGLQVQVGYKNSLQKRDGWWDLPPCLGDREEGVEENQVLSLSFLVSLPPNLASLERGWMQQPKRVPLNARKDRPLTAVSSKNGANINVNSFEIEFSYTRDECSHGAEGG